MSLDKAIQSGKEHRKPYRKAKAVDPHCRNHGPDYWSEENQLHASKKKELATREQIKETGNKNNGKSK